MLQTLGIDRCLFQWGSWLAEIRCGHLQSHLQDIISFLSADLKSKEVLKEIPMPNQPGKLLF